MAIGLRDLVEGWLEWKATQVKEWCKRRREERERRIAEAKQKVSNWNPWGES